MQIRDAHIIGPRQDTLRLGCGFKAIAFRVSHNGMADLVHAGGRKAILIDLGRVQPPPAARHSLTLLEQALKRSIEADEHYRDGFAALPARSHCPLPGNTGFRLASASDARATAAKRRFVGAFNPLARRYVGRTWSPGEF